MKVGSPDPFANSDLHNIYVFYDKESASDVETEVKELLSKLRGIIGVVMINVWVVVSSHGVVMCRCVCSRLLVRRGIGYLENISPVFLAGSCNAQASKCSLLLQ